MLDCNTLQGPRRINLGLENSISLSETCIAVFTKKANLKTGHENKTYKQNNNNDKKIQHSNF